MIFKIISSTYAPVKTVSVSATTLPTELDSNPSALLYIAKNAQLTMMSMRMNRSK